MAGQISKGEAGWVLDARAMGRQTVTSSSRAVLERLGEFWRADAVGAILLGFRLPRDHSTLYGVDHGHFQDGLLHPEDVEPQRFLPDIASAFREHQELNDDLLFTITPWWGIPWAEAIMGCPIWVRGGTIWAESYLETWDGIDELGEPENNAWVSTLLEALRLLVDSAAGRYAVGPAVLRGPADTAAALRGTERFYLDLYDNPKKVERLLRRCTEVILRVSQLQMEIIPPFYGGASNYMGVWAPGRNVVISDDLAAFMSPAFYRTFLEVHHRRLTEAFPWTLIHLHATGLGFLDHLLAMPGLDGVQIVIEPSGPSVSQLIPTLRKVQARKRVVLVANKSEDMHDEDLFQVIEALCTGSLFVIVERSSVAEAQGLLSRVRHHFPASVD